MHGNPNFAGGCVVVGLMLVVAIIVVGIALVPGMLSDLNNSRASELRAEAVLEQVRAEREHQASVDWQHEFVLYTVALKSFTGSHMGLVVFLSVVLGVVAGFTFSVYIRERKMCG